jgi:hypothetical protein
MRTILIAMLLVVGQLAYGAPINVAPSGDTSGATDYSNITAAIVTASTAGGGVVSLTGNIYYLNNPLSLPSKVTLIGQGKEITQVISTDIHKHIIQVTGNSVTIKDMLLAHYYYDWVSNYTNANWATITGSGVITTNNSGIYDLTIENCNVLNCDYGIKMVATAPNYNTGVRLTHLMVGGCVHFGIFADRFAQSRLRDVYVNNCGQNPAVITNGNIYSGGGLLFLASQDNRLDDCWTFLNYGNGVRFDQSSSDDTASTLINHMLCDSNILEGLFCVHAECLSITDSWFSWCGSGPYALKSGVYFEDTHELTFIGNKLASNGSHGVWVGTNCVNITLDGNTVYCNSSNSYGNAGIYASGEWKRLTISNNICTNRTGLGLGNTQFNGIYVSAGDNYLMVTGNQCSGNVSTGVVDASDGSVTSKIVNNNLY